MSKQQYTVRLSDGSVQAFVLDVGKRKRLSMTFVEGELYVRVPYGCSKRQINEFILSNTDWIKKNNAEQSKRVGLPKTYENGERIRLLGKQYEIEYTLSDKYFKPYLSGDKLCVAVCEQSTLTYKKSQVDGFINMLAAETVIECMERMSVIVGETPTKLTLRSMTSRWGSCSSKGHICINYKIVQFPIECIEYVCVHELCHMRHMDHSKQFWELVEQFCPDRERLREIMKY